MIDTPALHAHALASLEAADIVLAHADLAIDGAYLSEHVTREFVDAEIGGHIPGAALTDLVVEAEHDGMTERRKWRLEWNDVGAAAGLPGSVFVKATPDGPYLRETLAMLHMAEHEVRFYAEVQPEVSMIAPRGWFGRSYPGGRFLLVVGDLEASGCRPFWSKDHCTPEHARAVVTALATLHARFWQSDRFDRDLSWVRPRTRKLGAAWHRRSFVHARKAFLASDRGLNLPASVRDTLELWSMHDLEVYDYWDRLPATLLHGDSHLGNTYAKPDGSAGLFDWQVIFRGPGLRDLGYFMLSALSDDERRVQERGLFNHYCDELDRRGIHLDREKGWRDLSLLTLDSMDAVMKTIAHGGYGHAASGLERSLQSRIGAMIDRDVGELLATVIANGEL
ncbi:MAG: phosphotransferase [Candidatus Sphingomonas colombiensis]|nr:phosphotransferase [Sphingomonas sp.]WEK42367.1 MAG: phosphotransferase [Sphingomonas sp.]